MSRFLVRIEKECHGHVFLACSHECLDRVEADDQTAFHVRDAGAENRVAFMPECVKAHFRWKDRVHVADKKRAAAVCDAGLVFGDEMVSRYIVGKAACGETHILHDGFEDIHNLVHAVRIGGITVDVDHFLQQAEHCRFMFF